MDTEFEVLNCSHAQLGGLVSGSIVLVQGVLHALDQSLYDKVLLGQLLSRLAVLIECLLRQSAKREKVRALKLLPAFSSVVQRKRKVSLQLLANEDAEIMHVGQLVVGDQGV